jgi:hypothetical protein
LLIGPVPNAWVSYSEVALPLNAAPLRVVRSWSRSCEADRQVGRSLVRRAPWWRLAISVAHVPIPGVQRSAAVAAVHQRERASLTHPLRWLYAR